MAYDVNRVIAIAKAEVGYLEKRNGDVRYLYSKTANAGYANYTKYGFELHRIYPKTMDYPAYWCDCFVDWCFYKAYGVSNAQKLLAGEFDDYTINSSNLYKKKNAWYKSNPRIGDQIFFTNSKGRICHTGLVYKVDSKYVYTIEGNTSSAAGVDPNGGCVAYKQYLLTYSRIAGYGRPNYADTAISEMSTTSVKSNTKLVSSKPTVPPGKPNLLYGSKGESVKNLQKCLNYVQNSGLDTDGIFGTKTKKALIKFQTTNKIAIDGIYGPGSARKMTELIK